MIPRCYSVVKKRRNDGMVMMILAVFMDKDEAYKWAENANEWYGEDHPLTPLTVQDNDTWFEPRPFPVEAMRGPPKPDFTKWPFE